MNKLQVDMEELEEGWTGTGWGIFMLNGIREKRSAELKDRIMKVIEEHGGNSGEIKDYLLLCRTRAHIRTSMIATYQAMSVLVALAAAVLTVCIDLTKEDCLRLFMLISFGVIFIVGIKFMMQEYVENRRAAFYRCAAELLEDWLKEDKGKTVEKN